LGFCRAHAEWPDGETPFYITLSVLFRQSLQLQVGPQRTLREKHSQYSLRQRDFSQLQADLESTGFGKGEASKGVVFSGSWLDFASDLLLMLLL
jgi:hypothetical protein